VRERFNLNQLYLVHGIAVDVDGRGVVVMGPAGIGKSTVLRELIKDHKVKPIDDGFVLIGRDRDTGVFNIVPTGLYEVNQKFSRISKTLRVCCNYVSPFLVEDSSRFEGANIRGRIIQRVSRMAGYLVVRPPAHPSEGGKTGLDKILYVSHERDTLKPGEIGETSYKRIPFEEFLSKMQDVHHVRIKLPEELNILKKRMREEMLAP